MGALWPRGAKIGVVRTIGGAMAAQPATTAEQREALASDVEAREIAFAQTMADRDFEAFAAFVSPEAVFFDGSDPAAHRRLDCAISRKGLFLKRRRLGIDMSLAR